MGQVKKSTRKFESKHLTQVLDNRKANKKVKQAFILREKKKAKRAADQNGGEEAVDEDGEPKAKKVKPDGPQIFEDMSVEQFFAGGFEVPEAGVTGKRKRDGKAEKKDVPMEDAPAEESDDDDDMDEDQFESHKNDLNALAENDPEFFKYLQSNDPELLDFSMAERDDLSSIDDLSGDEDEEAGQKKGKKGKKEDESNEVTMAQVQKWKEALVEKKSLRSLRQVVLAFRSAAHVNDVEEDARQGGFKYTINNPDGKYLRFFGCGCTWANVEISIPRAFAFGAEEHPRCSQAPFAHQGVCCRQDVSP